MELHDTLATKDETSPTGSRHADTNRLRRVRSLMAIVLATVVSALP